jgi:hypothetical protein
MDATHVKVYSFEVVDAQGLHHMPFKATREIIESRYGGRIIEGTGEDVPGTALDGKSVYQRQASGWTPQRLQQLE